MKMLVWKEWRIHRMLFLFFVGLFGLAHAFGLGQLFYSTGFALPRATDLATTLQFTGSFCLAMTCLAAALLGGGSIATERADRSAHFLAYLPPTKAQNVVSKLILCAALLTALWGSMALWTRWIVPGYFGSAGVDAPPSQIGIFAAVALLMFGAGWLGSSLSEKTTLPVMLGLLAPMVVGMGLASAQNLMSAVAAKSLPDYPTLCAGLGLTAVVAGVWLYLRRVEP